MDNDIDVQALRQQAIDAIVAKEPELLAAQEKIQTIIDSAGAEFLEFEQKLEEKYDKRPEASADDFMREYRALEKRVKDETQAKIDKVVVSSGGEN